MAEHLAAHWADRRVVQKVVKKAALKAVHWVGSMVVWWELKMAALKAVLWAES